jgi:hypothetical protein
MLMPQMQINFQLPVMAPKGRRKGKGQAPARAKIPTLVTNPRQLLDRDPKMGFNPDHICGPLWIYNVCGIKEEMAWDLF